MKSKGIKTKIIVGAASLVVILGGYLLSGYIYNRGKVLGCNQMVAVSLPPQLNPVCGLRGDRLTLTVNHPLLGGIEITYDLQTGQVLQDE